MDDIDDNTIKLSRNSKAEDGAEEVEQPEWGPAIPIVTYRKGSLFVRFTSWSKNFSMKLKERLWIWFIFMMEQMSFHEIS